MLGDFLGDLRQAYERLYRFAAMPLRKSLPDLPFAEGNDAASFRTSPLLAHPIR